MPMSGSSYLGRFPLNGVTQGDCVELIPDLPGKSVDVVVTSPPYWGQRISNGVGNEDDPRSYVEALTDVFVALLPKLKDDATVWINIGDAYNTPVNWRYEDLSYSTLGADGNGLDESNSAYVKPRAQRRAFIDKKAGWLKYGNLLALPYRLVIALSDAGYYFRGEVIWRKKNPMPEGRCRRPHRQHESIYVLTKEERHAFRVAPPVGSVWEFANEPLRGVRHYSRFPSELPRRCIQAHGKLGPDVVVLDPFSGSATTGLVALEQGCSYIGFEIESSLVESSNEALSNVTAAARSITTGQDDLF